jgi:hypothetical protein
MVRSPMPPAYPNRNRASAQKPWWAWLAGALAVAGAIGIGLYLASTAPKPTSALPGESVRTPVHVDSPPTSTPVTSSIEHPIGAAEVDSATADATPLPPLDASDASVIDALSSMLGDGGIGALLNPQHVIQRIVATIDGLTRSKLGADTMPVRGASGAFATRATDRGRAIDARNAARYATYVDIVRKIDAKALVAWYVKTYPLFQQAYRELGYPDGYFNDRLVAVIDHLLATPDLDAPAALTQPNVLYEFADPTLESRSSGQKMLLRSGPENEAAIKAKLREIRAALTGQTLPAAAVRDASNESAPPKP